MYRISFERLCRKGITAAFTILNREHDGVRPVNICEFCRKRRIFMEVIVRTDRQTEVKRFSTFVPLLWVAKIVGIPFDAAL